MRNNGTLYRALKAIADQVSTKVIVVRVAEHKEEDGKTQDQLVIGGSEDDGSYTGCMRCLLQSRMKASDTVRVFWPRRSWTRRR